LIAVAALEVDPDTPSTWDLHVVAIANDHQSTRTMTRAGELPLVKVVLDTAMQYATDRGAELIRTIVATRNTRSLRMLSLQGFTRTDRIDNDYDEYVARTH
jgi:ribosomal protein S18 acetylase RimI-like enzyme